METRTIGCRPALIARAAMGAVALLIASACAPSLATPQAADAEAAQTSPDPRDAREARGAGAPPADVNAVNEDGTRVRNRPPEPQTCGAAEFSHLIGQSVDLIEPDSLPPRARVVCKGCLVTRDFRPGRLNIYLDEDRKITRLRCG